MSATAVQGEAPRCDVRRALTPEEIYLMVMLHKYQGKSCAELARRFSIPPGQAYDIIAGRSHSGCCG